MDNHLQSGLPTKNSAGFTILALVSMLYMSIMLCSAVLTNRYVGTNDYFILGGTLISPIIFILNDIAAEIYGFKITRFIIISGFVAQTLFALICQFIILAPYPCYL